MPFDHLTVDVINIRAVTFLAEERVPRIRRSVIGNIQHPAIHRREQNVNLFRHLALFHAGLHFHRQRLVRAHFLRRFQRQRQTAVFIAQRQMQQADRAFRRRRSRFIAGANHQRAEVEIVAIPGFIHRNRQIHALRRDVNFLPPQRPFAGFDHRVAFTRRRGGNMQLDGVARFIARFVELHRYAIRTRRAGAFAVILPAIARPEAHAADNVIRPFHLQTIRAPLYRETHFTYLPGLQIQRRFALLQIFLIELRLPAFAIGPVPVVIAPLADQPHLQPGDRFFLASGIGIDDVKSGVTVFIDYRLFHRGIGAVVVNVLQRKLRADPRQRLGRPDRLLYGTGHRTAA